MIDDVALKTLPATPVTYRFVSVHRIVGFSELRIAPELLSAQEMSLNLGIVGVSATLTVDPNPALMEVDRAAAFANLIMRRVFQGEGPRGDMLHAVREQAEEFAFERVKKFGTPGVYLVLEARGELFSSPTEAARDLNGALLVFNAVDKDTIKARYKPWVSAALAAVALCVDTTTDLTPVADGVTLTLPDGRPLYSLSITGVNAYLSTARPATDSDARAIEQTMAALMRDERLRSPSRLIVDSLRATTDRLEAFIFAWAALEMVIRKYTVGCESGTWIENLPSVDREIASSLHQGFIDGGHQYYSLADRVRVFALTHELASGEALAAEVTQIRKAYREPLYHEGTIADQLPVESVVALAKKVIAAATGGPRHLRGTGLERA